MQLSFKVSGDADLVGGDDLVHEEGRSARSAAGVADEGGAEGGAPVGGELADLPDVGGSGHWNKTVRVLNSDAPQLTVSDSNGPSAQRSKLGEWRPPSTLAFQRVEHLSAAQLRESPNFGAPERVDGRLLSLVTADSLL